MYYSTPKNTKILKQYSMLAILQIQFLSLNMFIHTQHLSIKKLEGKFQLSRLLCIIQIVLKLWKATKAFSAATMEGIDMFV